MSPPFLLLGPPELHRGPPSDEAAAATGDPLMDSMTANFNQRKPPMGYTENASPTFLSSGNPCLDFFFHIVPSTPAEDLKQRLDLAWNHNPLTTLKLVCNLRGVRGTGKSDKEGFYTVAMWLHKHHPKTLAGNVGSIADFGYFKDLPEILFRLLEGPDIRKILKDQRRARLSASAPTRSFRFGADMKRRKSKTKTESKVARQERWRMMEAAKKTRDEKRVERAKKVVERVARDPDFRFLYECVADLFSERLKTDIQLLNSGEANKISLASKWCPSIDSSFDRSTLICEVIARKVFPRESHPEYDGIEDAHYAYRIRDRLRKEILVPLHKALDLPEVYMSANQWSSLPYNRVPSVAMKLYKERFAKHDADRFAEYLEKVKSGKAKIAAGASLPHEILQSLEDADGGEVAELQWRRMVDDLSQKGKLRNCLAICDVSGSMTGTPMEVSVALGILVSEMSEEPWKGKVITFSADPQFHRVEGESLLEKTKFVREMDWGMNTDFQKVFDRILEVAVEGKLKEEQMIKRLFVFSDMEFDQASANHWETDYEVIRRKYGEKGYGNSIPEIVFWNLRNSQATPVPSNQRGVALVSGFSKNLLKMFLEESGVMNPEVVMEAAISGDEYQKLVVLD